MNTLKTYLTKFKTDTLTLIGPMFEGNINNKEPLVFIDGGSKNYKDIGFIVGDGDSSDIQMHEKLDTNKDFSDLAYVLSMIPSNIRIINAQGFLGGRQDHELINYGEFFKLLKRHPCRIHLSDLLTLYSPQVLELDFHGIFSVLNSSPGKLEVNGDCKYNFSDLAGSAYSSQFLSNLAHGKFRVSAEMPFGVYKVKE